MDTYRVRRCDNLQAVEVGVERSSVCSVRPIESSEDLPLAAPGLLDIQINGARHWEFSSPDLTVEGVREVIESVIVSGTFRFCPTLTTHTPEVLLHAAEVIGRTLKEYPRYDSVVVGIHMEGPFISAEEGPRGAHRREYVRSCYDLDLIDAVNRASGNRVKIVTFSPEYDRFPDFIAGLLSRGIVPAIGHTNASPVDIARAAAAGARLSTHLANATYHLLPKEGNYFFAQLTDDRLAASIIVDGFHLSPMMVKTILRGKGLERLILVSDLSGLAGMPPGVYNTELCEVEILESGKIVLASNRRLLAAASEPLAQDLCTMMAFTGLTISEVFRAATAHPAALLGLSAFPNGRSDDFLAVGYPAAFFTFRHRPAALSDDGLADWEGFRRGAFEIEAIVR